MDPVSTAGGGAMHTQVTRKIPNISRKVSAVYNRAIAQVYMDPQTVSVHMGKGFPAGNRKA